MDEEHGGSRAEAARAGAPAGSADVEDAAGGRGGRSSATRRWQAEEDLGEPARKSGRGPPEQADRAPQPGVRNRANVRAFFWAQLGRVRGHGFSFQRVPAAETRESNAVSARSRARGSRSRREAWW